MSVVLLVAQLAAVVAVVYGCWLLAPWFGWVVGGVAVIGLCERFGP